MLYVLTGTFFLGGGGDEGNASFGGIYKKIKKYLRPKFKMRGLKKFELKWGLVF